MILDIDLGNTRLKWRAYGASESSFLVPGAEALRQLASDLPDVSRVRIASVAAPELANDCEGWVVDAFGVEPELCRVRRKLGRFETACEDVERLGVDRWLVALAAWHQFQQDCVVVDAGTALTVDVVTAGGVHQGGYIVPGYKLMLEALWRSTGSVKVEPVSSIERLGPGRNTSDAVNRGALQMFLGMLERTVAGLERAPQIILTGGDASLLSVHLPDAVRRPDLVLDGLALACP